MLIKTGDHSIGRLVLSLFHYCNDLKFANIKQLVLF